MKLGTKLISLFVLSLLINGCSIFGGGNKVEKLTQTFFVGESGTQYYIKPLEFESDSEGDLSLDITLRYKDEIKDTATINFTLLNESVIKKLDYIKLTNDSETYSTDDITLLFAERKDDDFKSRFSFRIPMADLDKLMMNADWNLSFTSAKKEYSYAPTSSTKEKLKILNDDLFVIFR